MGPVRQFVADPSLGLQAWYPAESEAPSLKLLSTRIEAAQYAGTSKLEPL
jgi:hypothetical protein